MRGSQEFNTNIDSFDSLFSVISCPAFASWDPKDTKYVMCCWYFWMFNQSHLRSKPLRRIIAMSNQLFNADLLHQAIHQPLMKAEYGSSGEIISYLFFFVFTCPLWIQCLNFRRYLTPDRTSWRVFSVSLTS